MAQMQLFLLQFMEMVLAMTTFFAVGQSSGDTMIPGHSLIDGQTLTSAGGVFQLGFFSLVNGSANGYIGVWHSSLPPREGTVVWVANGNKSLNKSTAFLNLTSGGDLILFEENTVLWSTGTSAGMNSARLQLLDTGNLVLTAGESNRSLWRSFDHPSDTFVPGMKLGVDFRNNTSWQQVSWRSPTDPSPGDYVHKVRPGGVPDLVIFNGSEKVHRTGPWNGQGFVGHPKMGSSSVASLLKFAFVSNQNETYMVPEYTAWPTPVLSRSVLDVNGNYQRWVRNQGNWQLLWSIPEDECDIYNRCGPNSVCTRGYYNISCSCLEGFAQAEDGNVVGCRRKKPLNCSANQVGKVPFVKLPDTVNATSGGQMSLDACKKLCLGDCSCVAYAVITGPNGCITWRGDLLDLRSFTDGGDDLYVRLPESSTTPNRKKYVWAIATLVPLGFLLLSCVGVVFLWRKRNRASTGLQLQFPNVKKGHLQELSENCESMAYDDVPESRSSIMLDSEDSRLHNNDGVGMFNTLGLLPSYDLDTIKTATNNFSDENKLGEGGFGIVYKGELQDGQKIAIKKLSRYSSQGPDEFQNEISLIAKLQHRNLVRLLGSCIEGDERIIILEYMDNKSLDAFIYDKAKSSVLNWQKRLEIIIGIARGLLYLHQDSILRVIHRDLKPSNILLDNDMTPKISDFGIAKIFEGDETLENITTRPIGTFGYMAPEYVSYGFFSFKSDVFSFGVIVLEILSGRRNRIFSQTDSNLNLLGHAYRLWKEGRSLEILDDALGCSYPTIEILRCIRMALLCVQDNSEDRPTMAEVVMMLASEDQLLIPLKQPTITSANSEGDCSTKEMSLTFTGR